MMERCQEFIGVRCIEAENVYGEGKHLYNMHLTDTEIIRCRDCKHYIPEETWHEERGIGLYETVGEPPSCKKWSYIILGEDGRSSVYRPDVRPDGFCAWAERDA